MTKTRKIPTPLTTQPLVSVILPVFNGKEYLNEAIASVLNQSHEQFELIIINDGSTDGSEAIIREHKDPRIVTIDDGINRGLVASLNIGLERSSGKFIARLDADDLCEPSRLQEQVDFLTNNPAYIAIGCLASYIDHKGALTGKQSPLYSADGLTWLSLVRSPFHHPSVMFRRSVLDAGIRYRDKYPVEDFDMWNQIASIGHLGLLNRHLVRYRLHPGSVSAKHRDKQVEMQKTLARAFISHRLSAPIDWSSIESSYDLILAHDDLTFPALRHGLAALSMFIRAFCDDQSLEPRQCREVWDTALMEASRAVSRRGNRLHLLYLIAWIGIRAPSFLLIRLQKTVFDTQA